MWNKTKALPRLIRVCAAWATAPPHYPPLFLLITQVVVGQTRLDTEDKQEASLLAAARLRSGALATVHPSL